ncbi:MAG: adenosine kinase [Acidimicrobiales bacterium]|nr:MAG: adenosine kinase [Acidimicrobiales bacterium]
MGPDRIDVVAIGSAIVDVLARASDEQVAALGLAKGSMALVDQEESDRLLAAMGPATQASGGSAANTVVGVSCLGGSAAYLARVADDDLGQVFSRDIRSAGVRFAGIPERGGRAALDGGGTGRCLVLVTPDAERTMSTYLGVASQLGSRDVDAGLVGQARVLYVEGYLWDLPAAKEALRGAMAAARRTGAQVALSLSDSFCVQRHRDDFLALVASEVDVVFANQDEVALLTGEDDLEAALTELSGGPALWAVTRGAQGSVVASGRERVRVPAWPVEAVVDTTGAGDLYAAGFLLALIRGADLEGCARLGSLVAAEVIGHLGARPGPGLRELAQQVGLLS